MFWLGDARTTAVYLRCQAGAIDIDEVGAREDAGACNGGARAWDRGPARGTGEPADDLLAEAPAAVVLPRRGRRSGSCAGASSGEAPRRCWQLRVCYTGPAAATRQRSAPYAIRRPLTATPRRRRGRAPMRRPVLPLRPRLGTRAERARRRREGALPPPFRAPSFCARVAGALCTICSSAAAADGCRRAASAWQGTQAVRRQQRLRPSERG
jgi:hypothetical protein